MTYTPITANDFKKLFEELWDTDNMQREAKEQWLQDDKREWGKWFLNKMRTLGEARGYIVEQEVTTNHGKRIDQVWSSNGKPVVFIEHEHERSTLDQEWNKFLQHDNVSLKVIFAYPTRDKSTYTTDYWLECFEKGLGSASDLNANEYLVCFGPEAYLNQRWRFYKSNKGNGELVRF